jgi:hypothetical protein
MLLEDSTFGSFYRLRKKKKSELDEIYVSTDDP